MTHAIKDKGSVRIIRIALIPVRMRAQGPGPVGSAAKSFNNLQNTDVIRSVNMETSPIDKII